MDPSKRPPFAELVEKLKTIKNHRLVSQHTNPIAAKSQISVGHVRRHIYKFSGNGKLKKLMKFSNIEKIFITNFHNFIGLYFRLHHEKPHIL